VPCLQLVCDLQPLWTEAATAAAAVFWVCSRLAQWLFAFLPMLLRRSVYSKHAVTGTRRPCNSDLYFVLQDWLIAVGCLCVVIYQTSRTGPNTYSHWGLAYECRSLWCSGPCGGHTVLLMTTTHDISEGQCQQAPAAHAGAARLPARLCSCCFQALRPKLFV
jgi:hypothetical protein